MEHDEKTFKKQFRGTGICPNLRSKPKGLFKGNTYFCSIKKDEELDISYVESRCRFCRYSNYRWFIAYDECSLYREHGIVN